MSRYVVVSIVSGLLFGVMDALLNANPVAQRLFRVYSPIAKTSLNVGAGVAIDLAYGFAMAGVFLALYPSLPGGTGLTKGLSFALLAWFLRVVMAAASEWMTLEVPAVTLLYKLGCGLLEMAVLGALYGLTLRPAHAG